MVLPRPTAIRGFSPARVLRASAPRTANRAVVQRRYASGHGSSSSGGDITWALGATAITVPAVWYLWPDSSHGDSHGPGDAHAKRSEEHPEPEKEEPAEPAPKDKEDPKPEETKQIPEDTKPDEEKGEPTQEKPQSGHTPAPEESKSKPTTEGKNEPENRGDVEGVKFKGPTNEGDEQNRMPDERKREPDGKGAFKKRIDSGYGKNLGEGPNKRDDGSDSASPASGISKSSGDISNKQAGLSNTETRHSTDIVQDPNMSKKGEGAPETAKSMGTVSVNRPHTENQKGEESQNAPNADKKDE